MDILVILLTGGIAFAILFSIYIIIKLLKKKNIKTVVVEKPIVVPEQVNQFPPVELFIPKIKIPDQKLYEKFIKEYDEGNLKFNSVPFRPKANLTGAFGISEGYRYYVKGTNRLWTAKDAKSKRDMRWGYVRPHFGVDRSRAKPYTMKNGTIINDVVISPFNFNRSSIINYGDYSYGTLTSLWNDEYQFEFRIAHMNPNKDIFPWSFERLKNKGSFNQGWILGSAGTYGYSSGPHTHTEVKSYDESCEVFDILIEEIGGDKALNEYTPTQIIKEYKKYEHFKDASNKVIFDDWNTWKKKKKILFANPYKMTRIDPVDNKTVRSWYSTYLLFNKL